MPLDATELCGTYYVYGPALLRKVGNFLVATVQPGGRVEVVESSERSALVLTTAMMSHEDETPAQCMLLGQHLELSGESGKQFSIEHPKEGVSMHKGQTVLSVAHMREDAMVMLKPGGCCSHPVNVHPDVDMDDA